MLFCCCGCCLFCCYFFLLLLAVCCCCCCCSFFISFLSFLFSVDSASFASTSTKQMKKVKEKKGKKEESNKKNKKKDEAVKMKQRSRTEKPEKGRTQTNHRTRKLEQRSSMVGSNQTKQIIYFSSFVCLPYFYFFLSYSLFLVSFISLVCFKVKEAGLFVFCCFAFVAWAMSKEKTQKNKTPCFILSLFAVLSLQGFGNRKAKIKEESKTARRRNKKEEN